MALFFCVKNGYFCKKVLSMSHTKSQLSFKNFLVQDFEYKKVFEIEKPETGESVSLSIQPRALISRKNNFLHILLNTKFIDYKLEISIKGVFIGVFEFETDDEDLLINFLSLNAPAIIFPYIRSLISSFTSQSGSETVILPTLNLIRHKQEIIDTLIDIDEKPDSE